MGLDMYWFVEKTKEDKAEALIKGEDTKDREEIGYFRKFHDLNDFMGTLYPPEVGDYNTVELPITWDILAEMRAWPSIVMVDPETQKEFQEICDKIETHLNNNREVVYWPWW